METMLNAQQAALNKLDSMIESFKKEKPKKSIPKFYRNKIKELERWWLEFSARHSDLMNVNDKDDDYFEENHYAEILTKYSAHMNVLKAEIHPMTDQQLPEGSVSHGRLTIDAFIDSSSSSEEEENITEI